MDTALEVRGGTKNASSGALVRVDDNDTITEIIVSFGALPDVRGRRLTDEESPFDVLGTLDQPTGTVLIGYEADNEPGVRRALVIDDEALNREYYANALDALGWEVTVCPDSASGVNAFGEVVPDVVLVDVRLPDRNGYETVRQIRSADSGRSYIVLMSADPSMVESSRVKGAGADLALVGPIAPAQLKSLLVARRVQSVAPPSQAPTADWSSIPTADSSQGAAPIRLKVFGGIEVATTEGWVPCPQGRASELLAILTSYQPQALTPAQLGALAWSDGEPSAGSVYTAVSRLRSWLDEVGCSDIVESHRNGYRIGISPEQIDAYAFTAAASEALEHEGDDLIERATAALDYVAGQPFHGCVSATADSERVRLFETQAVLEERLAIQLILTGDTSKAIAVARDLAQRELWREHAWSILAVALYNCGRQREALEALRNARRLLVSTVGVEPGPDLREVESLVLDQSETLQSPEFIRQLCP